MIDLAPLEAPLAILSFTGIVLMLCGMITNKQLVIWLGALCAAAVAITLLIVLNS